MRKGSVMHVINLEIRKNQNCHCGPCGDEVPTAIIRLTNSWETGGEIKYEFCAKHAGRQLGILGQSVENCIHDLYEAS